MTLSNYRLRIGDISTESAIKEAVIQSKAFDVQVCNFLCFYHKTQQKTKSHGLSVYCAHFLNCEMFNTLHYSL